MLAILLVLLYFFASFVLLFFRLIRPRLGVFWFVSAITALIAWLVILLSASHLPFFSLKQGAVTLPLINFQLSFSMDDSSWPIAFSLSAFVLAFFLTSTSNLFKPDQNIDPLIHWVLTFFYAGMCLWAIFAQNIFTLLLAWNAMDLLWFFYKLITKARRRMILIGFTFRLIGTFLVMSAILSKDVSQTSQVFPIETIQALVLFLLGGWLRFISLGFESDPGDENGNNPFLSSIHFIPLSASILILFVRNSLFEPFPEIPTFLISISALIGLIGSLLLFLNQNKPPMIFFGLLSLFSFTSTAYLLGESYSASAWGVALILACSMLAFLSVYQRLLIPILLINFIGITALPFTPAWQGIRIFPTLDELSRYGYGWIFSLFASALILISFAQRFSIPKQFSFHLERWNWIVYGLGLALLPITQILVLFIGDPGLANDLEAFPSLSNSWVSLLAIGIVIIAWLINNRYPRRFYLVYQQVTDFSLANWIAITLDKGLTFFIRLVRFIDHIIEGEGGILWTVLFLLLLITLYIQLSLGG